MSRARDFADLAGSADAGGLTGRNLIINGAMQVAQRGTSFSNPNGYTLDRFRNYVGTGGALTVTQESFTVGQTDVPTAKYFMRMDQTTARTGGAFLLQHRIEDVQSIPEGNIVLSFYAKADASKELKIQPYQLFGSGGSSTVSLTKQTLTLGTSWQKFTFVINNTSISGKTVGTGSYFMIEIRDESQGTYTFDLALLQLEVGEQATPFEHRSFADELARCKRYFQKYNSSTGRALIFAGDVTSGDNYFFSGTLVKTMRTAPTLSLIGSLSASGFNAATFNTEHMTESTVRAYATADSTGARRYFQFNCDFDAEL